MEIAIKVEGISKIYKLYDNAQDRLKESIHPLRKKYHREFYALHDVDVEIPKGATIGIIGRNGSGKSTLLKIISGVLTPTSGAVKINGRVSALLELGAGFNPEYTGIENVYLNGTIMGYSKSEIDDKIDDILAFAEIGEFAQQPVKSYSSGMFLRLAFAVAVNVDPDILIVDEALAVGDMQFQLKCINKMKTFKESGKTILFVSHDTYSIRNFCDYALWMMNGRIHLRGDVNSIIEQYEDFMKPTKEIPAAAQTKTSEKESILTIDNVSFLDMAGNDKSIFKFCESFTIAVKYTLHSSMEGLVGGVALFDKQNTYVCGLNTKLDAITLPSNPGEHTLFLTYHDVTILPGTYYIDVGFFESSAVVQLDYKSKMHSFIIESGEYLGEGLTLIKHEWQRGIE
jgi:teichoic acid transport system ATP-binding protein